MVHEHFEKEVVQRQEAQPIVQEVTAQPIIEKAECREEEQFEEYEEMDEQGVMVKKRRGFGSRIKDTMKGIFGGKSHHHHHHDQAHP